MIRPGQHQIVGVEAKDKPPRAPRALAFHLDGAVRHVLDRDGALFGRDVEDVAADTFPPQAGREPQPHRRTVAATTLVIPVAVGSTLHRAVSAADWMTRVA